LGRTRKRRRPSRPAPCQGPPKRSHERANIRTAHGPAPGIIMPGATPLGRRPRIPSHLSTISNNTPCIPTRDLNPGRPADVAAKGVALIAPCQNPVNPIRHSGSGSALCSGASAPAAKHRNRRVPCPGQPQQKIHNLYTPPQISPTARSSASICSSGGSCPPKTRSGGATAAGR